MKEGPSNKFYELNDILVEENKDMVDELSLFSIDEEVKQSISRDSENTEMIKIVQKYQKIKKKL